MKLRKGIALLIAEILIKLLRLSGRGGTSLPGKIALKIYPSILKELSSGIKTIVVTGTNGKTTTSRIIAEMFTNSNLSFFENKSGANLISGITTTFIENHKNNNEYAIIECDEAAFKTVSKHINVQTILVTNFFRDQLDRFGEITHTLNNIITGIKNCENATVCLNADCSLSSSIKEQVHNDIIFYGINVNIANDQTTLSDAPYCIKCKTKYEYTYKTYGHMGGFYCPSCHYKQYKALITVNEISSLQKNSSTVLLSVKDEIHKCMINLPGVYNIYNALSALAVGYSLSFNTQTMIQSLATFKGGFGRMENLLLNNVDTHIILVKNPAGLNNVIDYLNTLEEPIILTFLLNDQYADGTDVSWIWDVQFEKLLNNIDQIKKICIGGIRCDDMALRLKYANIPLHLLEVYRDYNSLINEITDKKHNNNSSYILPTYTAMFDIRLKLTKQFKLKEFWK